MRLWQQTLFVMLGIVATGASSLVPRSSIAYHQEIMGCESGCVVAAGGWPLPYLLDYPGISPVGSVSLMNALLGIDRIAAMPLLINLGFWVVVAAAIVLPLKRATRTGA